ncbi:MAG: flagellar hook-associated protein FlgK [Planctomycetota bacterium]
MKLYSTMQLAKNALFAAQTGIQVASNNIANADTPGYVRQRAILTPSETQKLGTLVAGSGVRVDGIVRQVDEHLQERMRYALSDMDHGKAQESVYVQLESAIGELSESDLSTALNEFFSSLDDVLNQPEDSSVRGLAVLQGSRLAEAIQGLDRRVSDLRTMTNDRVVDAAGEMNELIQQIATLNSDIIGIERGGAITSDAVGLRDKRDKALEELAGYVNIKVKEQASGGVNVFVGGNYLVFDGATQLVRTVEQTDRGHLVDEPRLSKTDAPLEASSGELAGLLAGRDQVLGKFMDDLDSFTRSLIFEFNKLHSSGQGLSGLTTFRSEHRIDDVTQPLDEAGLEFTPVHGAFQVQVLNKDSGLTTTSEVEVQLSGMADDTTAESLVASLDAIAGLSAEIEPNGKVLLESESSDLEFAFGDDSSGVLAALGINTFFTGSMGADIQVQDTLKEDPAKLAFSSGGVGHDSRNGEQLAQMLTMPLESRDGASLESIYQEWMGATAQESSLAQAIAEGHQSFHATLEAEHLGLSGVGLDEEAINMMNFQRNYQAAAKIVSTISELLETLLRM